MATKALNAVVRGDNAATVYGAQARNRLRAVVDVAIEMATSGKRKLADGRDVYEVMADAIVADPLGAFAALDKLLPGGDKEQGKGAALHIGTLYLQAVQQAQPQAGYIEGTCNDKSLITLNDW